MKTALGIYIILSTVIAAETLLKPIDEVGSSEERNRIQQGQPSTNFPDDRYLSNEDGEVVTDNEEAKCRALIFGAGMGGHRGQSGGHSSYRGNAFGGGSSIGYSNGSYRGSEGGSYYRGSQGGSYNSGGRGGGKTMGEATETLEEVDPTVEIIRTSVSSLKACSTPPGRVVRVDVDVGDPFGAVAAERLDREDGIIQITKPACPIWETMVGAAWGGVNHASVLEEFASKHGGPGGGCGAAVDFGEDRVHVGAKGMAGFDVIADGLVGFGLLQGCNVIWCVE